MFAQKKHILALTKIKRTRMFPRNGQVFVRVGQKIGANDAIGEYIDKEEFSLINIRKELNLKKTIDARKIVKLRSGDKLKADDIIVETGGIFSKIIRAPFDAEIIAFNSSQMLLRNISQPVPLLAGVDSVVTELLPDRGAILEVDGALIQSAWGNDKIQSGLLNPSIESPEDKLDITDIDVTFRGSIVIGGYCDDINVLKYANELPVKGLILSSMHPDLIVYAKSVEYAIILTDGFGPIPMNQRAFELLTTNSKRDASINGVFDPKQGEYPEIIIPLQSVGFLPNDIAEYKSGLIVRVNSGEMIGQLGQITQVDSKASLLENGIKAQCAIIRLNQLDEEDNQIEKRIPLANIDVVE